MKRILDCLVTFSSSLGAVVVVGMDCFEKLEETSENVLVEVGFSIIVDNL